MRPDPACTLTGLRARLDFRLAPPPVLTREEYQGLTPDGREAFDAARLEWFGAGFQVRTAETMGLLRTVKGYLRTSHPCTVGEKVVVLDGPANVGKTTMLLRLAREVEQVTARTNPDYRGDGQVPVVYLQAPPRATPKMIAATVLDFFATPVGSASRTQRDLVANATDLLLARDTRLLMVDEVQMLRLTGPHGDDAMDTLKSIINNAGVVTVLAGIDLTCRLGSRAAEQIMARGQVRPVLPYPYAGEKDRSRWAGLVAAFATQMHLIDSGAAELLGFADLLHAVTGGRIGALRRVLAGAMAQVIDEKPDPAAPERIGEEHLTEPAAPGFATPAADDARATGKRVVA